MLGDISLAANIYIMTGYTNMQKFINGLCAIVVELLKEESNGHSVYLFCGKRCDRRTETECPEEMDSPSTFERNSIEVWLCTRIVEL